MGLGVVPYLEIERSISGIVSLNTTGEGVQELPKSSRATTKLPLSALSLSLRHLVCSTWRAFSSSSHRPRHPSTSAMRIAVVGCSHGTLDDIYASVERCDAEARSKGEPEVDLMICCGDFQVSSPELVELRRRKCLRLGAAADTRAGYALSTGLAHDGLSAQVPRVGTVPQLLRGKEEGAGADDCHWGEPRELRVHVGAVRTALYASQGKELMRA